jgi:hypothetical protein
MRSRSVLIAGIATLALIGAGALWFAGRDTPDAVDLDRAVADVAAAAPAGEGEGVEGASDSDAVVDASGTWTVDVDVVEFDTATGSGSWVGYRIDEVLAGRGAFTAVGRSPRIEGEVTIEGDRVVAAEIRADLQGLESDNGTRDGRVRPIFRDRPVTFLLTEPFSFGAIPGEGERVTASTRGILRIGDVEREIDFELSGNVVGSRLVVAGSTLIVLADFDIEVPGSNVVLSVSDEATIELQLYLTRD